MKSKNYYLGEFESVVLIALLRLGDNAYGVPIRQLIEKETGRTTSFGAVYTTLDRLERKGYVSSKQGAATSERGGKAKRYYKIEGAGAEALNQTIVTRNKMLTGLGPEWGTLGA